MSSDRVDRSTRLGDCQDRHDVPTDHCVSTDRTDRTPHTLQKHSKKYLVPLSGWSTRHNGHGDEGKIGLSAQTTRGACIVEAQRLTGFVTPILAEGSDGLRDYRGSHPTSGASEGSANTRRAKGFYRSPVYLTVSRALPSARSSSHSTVRADPTRPPFSPAGVTRFKPLSPKPLFEVNHVRE